MPYSRRPREHDTRCPDGFACYGWRRVCKAGYVNWYGRRYYHEDLRHWSGLFVYVTISDWLAIEVEIWSTPWQGEPLQCAMESDADYCTRKKLTPRGL